METYYIENEKIKIGINLHGAELVSVVKKETGKEYMWCGDAKYWGRVSPVLFPFVGKLNQQKYVHNGIIYENIPQHGFARDCDFVMVEKTDDIIWFELTPDSHCKSLYPFSFLLRIGYRIEGSSIHVMWTVRNDDSETLYFSIGAHPAFACDQMNTGKNYTLDFHIDEKELESGMLNADGVLSDCTKSVVLNSGLLPISEHTFDDGALILDSKNIHTVSLKDENGKDFLQVRFDTPQLGIWSPEKKNAPFVCIEPWFGRCDRDGFDGELQEREYGNSLLSGHSYNKEYVIDIM